LDHGGDDGVGDDGDDGDDGGGGGGYGGDGSYELMMVVIWRIVTMVEMSMITKMMMI
jgi:hypothetical protein